MKKILAIFLLIFLIGCTQKANPNLKEISIKTWDKNVRIFAEIADNNDERAKGLMFREKLEENNGMIFIFEQENEIAFWMKNTLIPLDIIFIGKNFKIVDIKNAVPCKQDPCQLYKPQKSAQYVLEVNSGFAEKNGIKVNDEVEITN